MKLRTRLLSSIIPVIVILIILAGILLYTMISNYALDLLELSLQSKYEDIDSFIIRIFDIGQTYDIFETSLQAMISTYAISLQIGQKGYVAVIDYDGKVIYQNTSSKIKDENTNSPIFNDIKNTKVGKTFSFIFSNEKFHGKYLKIDNWKWYIVVGASDEEYLSPINRLIEYLSIILGSIIFIAIIVVTIISYQVSRPVAKLQKSVLNIMETNVFVPIDIKKTRVNEVDDLVSLINNLILSFSNIIDGVNKEFYTLEKHSENNEMIVKQIEENVVYFSDQIKEIIVSIEETVAHNTEIVEKINQVAQESKLSLETVRVGSELLNEFKLKTQNLIKQVENMTLSITSISEISDQTNLLSLNAAIESAKAGEVGKGFEVVSSEIRKLADESDKITRNITKTIKQLKNELRDFLEKFQQLFESFIKIQNDIASISDTNIFVNNASESQKNSLDRIAESITNMNLKFEDFRVIANKLTQDSLKTREVIADLTEYVSKYKTRSSLEENKDNVTDSSSIK